MAVLSWWSDLSKDLLTTMVPEETGGKPKILGEKGDVW